MNHEPTVFDKIINREIPAEIVYEDEHCLAFKDINPQAPVHILVIPKKPIVSLADIDEQDAPLMGHLLVVLSKIARQVGLESGYRTVLNTGPDGGQEVNHLHFHLLGKRSMKWPPG